jgi:hypothetical protein
LYPSSPVHGVSFPYPASLPKRRQPGGAARHRSEKTMFKSGKVLIVIFAGALLSSLEKIDKVTIDLGNAKK